MDDIKRRADRLRELERQRGERPDDPVVVKLGVSKRVMCRRDDVKVRSDGAASISVVAPDPHIVTDCCIDDVREVR
jgi:hypothetical protein